MKGRPSSFARKEGKVLLDVRIIRTKVLSCREAFIQEHLWSRLHLEARLHCTSNRDLDIKLGFRDLSLVFENIRMVQFSYVFELELGQYRTILLGQSLHHS